MRSTILGRFGRLLALAICACTVLGYDAEAALVRVNLGIYGGLTNDLAAYEDSSGSTRVLAAVDGDVGGLRLNNAGTRWSPIFFGRPGALGAVEADVTAGGVGSGAGVVYALTPQGQLLSNDSDTTGMWSRAAWATVTNGGIFHDGVHVVEGISVVVGAASGTYVGTFAGNVYRTTDGGATWTLLASVVASARVESIAPYVDDPSNPSLYVIVDNAGTKELYPLSYAGSYGVGAQIPVAGGAVAIQRVYVYPSTAIAEAPLLLVTGDSPSQALYRGPTGGTSWSTVTKATHFFQGMSFDTVNDRIFAVASVSTDRGLTWTDLPTYARAAGDIHANDGTAVLDPNDSSRLLVGTDWFAGEYTEAAGLWTAAGEIVTDNAGVTAVLINDMHQIGTSSALKDTFAIGGKAGLGIATDYLTHAGAHPTWTFPVYPMNDGAPITALHLQDYDADGSVVETVMAANNGGKLYKSTSGGTTAAAFTQVFNAGVDTPTYTFDADRVLVSDIAESPTSADELYLAFGDWDGGNVAGGIACSVDAGDTWTIDPAWATFGDSMLVRTLVATTTRLWAGVGKSDDADPAHRGVYAKIGSLSGCGTGTWSQMVSSTDLDSAIVYDLEAPNSSLTYAASSAGLFYATRSGAVWTWQELTGSADPELAKLPSGTYDEYVALAYNPAPAGYDEEFFAAVGDEIYRLRLLGATWTVDKISPTPHEDVNVLLWDELLVGGDGSVASLGVPSKSQRTCRAAVQKARAAYVKTAQKAMAHCRDDYATGGASCPDATAQAAIDKAAAKVAFAAKCSDDDVEALAENWPGSCWNVVTAAALDTCVLADAVAAVAESIAADYGAESPGRVGVALACQKAIGASYGGKLLSAILKGGVKCESSLDKGRAVACPDASADAKVDKAKTKAAAKITSMCSNTDVAALDALGFGGTCSGVGNATSLAACLAADQSAAADRMLSVPEDAF